MVRWYIIVRKLQWRPSEIETIDDRIPELRQTHICPRKGLIDLFFTKEKIPTPRHIFEKHMKYQDDEKMHTD